MSTCIQDPGTAAVFEAFKLPGVSSTEGTAYEIEVSWCEGIIHSFTCLQLESISSIWKFLAGILISDGKKDVHKELHLKKKKKVPYYSSLCIVNCFRTSIKSLNPSGF